VKFAGYIWYPNLEHGNRYAPEDFSDGFLADYFCPLGAVGERLNVREMWKVMRNDYTMHREVFYKADTKDGKHITWEGRKYGINKWCYPATMQLKDVRLTPTITSIEVKPVGKIMEAEISMYLGYETIITEAFAEHWNARYTKPGEQWPDAQAFFVTCEVDEYWMNDGL